MSLESIFFHHNIKLILLIYSILSFYTRTHFIFLKLPRSHFVLQRQIDIRHGPIAGKLTVRNRNTGRPATHTFHSNFSPHYIACLFRINQYLIRWPRIRYALCASKLFCWL